MSEATRSSDTELSRSLWTAERFLALVVDIEKDLPVLRKFEFGTTVQKALLEYINGGADFTSLTEGYPLDIIYDKSKPPVSMWQIKPPIKAVPEPFSPDMITAIQEAYPEGGLSSLLFIPSVEFQLKEFSPAGKASNIELNWNLLKDLPSIGSEATEGPSRRAEVEEYRSSSRTSKRDPVVDPNDDIPF
jgi:hypothetical protein